MLTIHIEWRQVVVIIMAPTWSPVADPSRRDAEFHLIDTLARILHGRRHAHLAPISNLHRLTERCPLYHLEARPKFGLSDL